VNLPTDPVTEEEKLDAAKQLMAEALNSATSFMLTFMLHPDHVAVIVAASKMDELLAFAIRKRLLPCPQKKDELLESERGLGTFSNRIDLAYRLGLISADLARALHIFRRIRNDFAHAYEGQSLDVAPHKDRVEELSTRINMHPNITNLRKIIGAAPNIGPQKLSFIIAATLVITRLETIKPLIGTISSEPATHAKFP
jgi:hypothetical protein